MKVCLVIPSYNEEKNILKVYKDIQDNAKGYDYVFINDCSTDNSKAIFEQYGLNVINLPVNLGLTGAVQTGYKYAYENGYDFAVQFDGDGQHQAKYLKSMVEKCAEGYDIVIGSRFVDEKKPWSLRMIGSRIISFSIYLKTGKIVKDPTSGLRMLNAKMLKDYAYNINRKPEPDTLVYQMKRGAKITEVQVSMQDRTEGTSLYSGLFSSFKYMFKMLVSIIFIS